MFDIGLQELVLIFVIALLVFGPKNLPQLGRSLGRAMREFKRASDEFRSTIETNLEINEPDPPPYKAPEIASAEATATGSTAVEPSADPLGAEPLATAEADPATDSGEPYVSQRAAKLFHTRGCAWVRKVAEADRTYFKSVAEAREAGLSACPVCEPWEPA